MNESTDAVASSRADGMGGRAGAVAIQTEPPRTKAKVVALGAHSGEWYVPLPSLVWLLPSGRTWKRLVSVPSRIASCVDQLASARESVVWVAPCVSATTTWLSVRYRT